MKSYSYQTVIKAVNGNNDSLCNILAEYELYICKIATQKVLSRDKCQYHQLIEESKSYVYENLVMEIRRYNIGFDLSESDIKNTFDCFCKKVIRHSLFRFFSNDDKRKKKEIFIEDDSDKRVETIAVFDRYCMDKHIFTVLGRTFEIENETLAAGLLSLTEEKKQIILMHSQLGMSDEAISQKLNIPRRTVNYKRTSTITKLKKFMETNRD